jgi:ABC-type uncharacterized transport system auxiliary subunit
MSDFTGRTQDREPAKEQEEIGYMCTGGGSRVPKSNVLGLVLLAVGIMSGCGGARPFSYYQLSVPSAAPQPGESAIFHVSILVTPMMTSHLYRQDRIVYSTGPQTMETYQYQRWAAPPSEMIGDVIVRTLRASGRYAAVSLLRSNAHGDFLLRGNLYDFKEVSVPAFSTRVTFELELRDTKTGATVWNHYYTHDEPVGAKNISAVVASMDHNFQMGVGESMNSLDSYFSAHRPQ